MSCTNPRLSIEENGRWQVKTRALPQKSCGIGKTALPPVVRMGFALPLAVVLLVAAMPHAPKTQEDPEGHSPDKKGPIVRKGRAASSHQAASRAATSFEAKPKTRAFSIFRVSSALSAAE